MKLVVGATGQLGGLIARQLLQQDSNVRVLVRPNSTYQPLVDAGALPVFGDLKDPSSRVSQLHDSRRFYRVLDDLGTRPNVGYLKKVRNPLETA